MSCAIITILEAEKKWLNGKLEQAIKKGNSTHFLDEAWTENDRRFREHQPGTSCFCDVAGRARRSSRIPFAARSAAKLQHQGNSQTRGI